MDDWWAPIIGTITGFLAAWGLLQLTERRRRRMAQAVTRRAVVAELRHAEMVLSSVIVNLSIGTDAVRPSRSGPSAFSAPGSLI